MVKYTKAVVEKLLGNVPEDKRFWCHDGQEFRNLRELANGLNVMTEETYSYHANSAKNDFSSWVKDVIGDEKLAGDLLRSIGKAETVKFVSDRITWLKGKLR